MLYVIPALTYFGGNDCENSFCTTIESLFRFSRAMVLVKIFRYFPNIKLAHVKIIFPYSGASEPLF
jgi:hypothetical protein